MRRCAWSLRVLIQRGAEQAKCIHNLVDTNTVNNQCMLRWQVTTVCINVLIVSSSWNGVIENVRVVLITGRATAGIAITQQAIVRFFAPQGRHDSRISVKFGTAEGTCGPLRRAKFHANQWIFGGFGPKKREKLPKFSTFSPRRGKPLPDVDEMRTVYAGNRSTKLLTFGAIRLVN